MGVLEDSSRVRAARSRRGVPGIVGVLLGAFAGAAVAPAAVLADEVPRFTVNEPAIATAKPSAIYFEQTYTGYLRNRATGKLLSRTSVTFQRRCSGVVVSPDGYILTANRCVRPTADVILTRALYELGRGLVTSGGLAADRLDGFVAEHLATSVFTGRDRRGAPAVSLVAQFDIATPGIRTAPAMTATVVRARPGVADSLALVKVKDSNLPTVELNTAPLDPGTSVIALGFGKGGTPETAEKYTVHAATVSVTAPIGARRLGIDGALGPSSLGGPVVDHDGRLVAILDADVIAENEPNHDLITAADIDRLLMLHEVANRLTATDRAYRAALSTYFDGRFSGAMAQFDEVLRVAPARELAKAYRYQAQRRLALGGDSVENAADWPPYVLSAIAGVLLIGTLSLVFEGVSRRLRPAAVGAARRVRHDVTNDETVILATSHPADDADRVPQSDDTVVLDLSDLADTVVLPKIPPAHPEEAHGNSRNVR